MSPSLAAAALPETIGCKIFLKSKEKSLLEDSFGIDFLKTALFFAL